jgi:DNA polymerase-3 subunit gamma/tau
MLLKGEEDIRRSTLPKIALEMLLVRLASLPKLESLDGLLDRLSSIESTLGEVPHGFVSEKRPSPPVPSNHETPSSRDREEAPGRHVPRPPSESSGEFDLTSMRSSGVSAEDKTQSREWKPHGGGLEESGPGSDDLDRGTMDLSGAVPPAPAFCPPEQVAARWPGFLQWLQNKEPVLAAKLSQSEVGSVEEGTLDLEVLEVFEDAMRDPESLAKLTGAVDEFFAGQFRISLRRRSPAKPAQKRGQKGKHSRANRKILVMEDPVVQQALEILGAEIVEIRKSKGGDQD